MSDTHRWAVDLSTSRQEYTSANFTHGNATFRKGICRNLRNYDSVYSLILQQIAPYVNASNDVEYNVILYSEDGRDHFSMRSRHDFAENNMLIIPVPDAGVLLGTKIEDYFSNKNVIFYSQLEQRGSVQEIPADRNILPQEHFRHKLMEDFASLFMEVQHSDLDVVTIDHHKIPCHRVILSARIPFFKERLVSHRDREISVDANENVMRDILSYAYRARLQENSNILRLFKAADTFGMSDLKDFCKRRVLSNITRQNVCDALKFAYQCKDDDIKEACLSYVIGDPDPAFLNLFYEDESYLQFSRENHDLNEHFLKDLSKKFRDLSLQSH